MKIGISEGKEERPGEAQRIVAHGAADPPSHETAMTYVGRIVSVIVGGTARPEGTPFGEFIRFARVVAVRARTAENAVCEHCEGEANSMLEVVWETGYTDSGRTICEGCQWGVVTEGEESIEFPGEER